MRNGYDIAAFFPAIIHSSLPPLTLSHLGVRLEEGKFRGRAASRERVKHPLCLQLFYWTSPLQDDVVQRNCCLVSSVYDYIIMYGLTINSSTSSEINGT